MHILATFATLCCQTRWPRNHSCTTQEHVSFFRDIFGTFSEISTFSSFSSNLTKTVKNAKTCRKTKIHVRALLQKRTHKRAHVEKCFHVCKTFLHMHKNTNAQICKCAKTRRAQNAQICSAHFFANATFCTVHNSANAHFTISQIQISAECKYFLVQVYFFVQRTFFTTHVNF